MLNVREPDITAWPPEEAAFFLCCLTTHPYWSRVWVIQEFLLNKEVDICCGSTRINWLRFKEYLYDFQLLHNSAAALRPLLTARHPDDTEPYLQPLLQLLVHYRHSSCKDPRDRVFALLGLVTPAERDALCEFFPDYNLSHDEVVVIALAHLMRFHPRRIKRHEADDIFMGLGVMEASATKKRRLFSMAGKHLRLRGLGEQAGNHVHLEQDSWDNAAERGGKNTTTSNNVPRHSKMGYWILALVPGCFLFLMQPSLLPSWLGRWWR
ncbi:hypothetical protein B0H63DRAFT_485793 [Podospora didyma]|uniref:Heterokaryon incompatibility domain-containing protein n=1 Tax=Podospora didyma TaxID=330526 RepID=A0AAE0K4R7_9PEZI|nr:hypothetical protein B0H63DRAFT_485793 [Podospora didyma]